jgi:hypothetical protein
MEADFEEKYRALRQSAIVATVPTAPNLSIHVCIYAYACFLFAAVVSSFPCVQTARAPMEMEEPGSPVT